MKPYRVAQGFVGDRGLNRKIAVGFDTDQFEHINALAVKRRISFGAAVRELCRRGLAMTEAIDAGSVERADADRVP